MPDQHDLPDGVEEMPVVHCARHGLPIPCPTCRAEQVPDDLFKLASDALYEARNSGRSMDQAAADIVRALAPAHRAAAVEEERERLREVEAQLALADEGWKKAEAELDQAKRCWLEEEERAEKAEQELEQVKEQREAEDDA